MKTSGDFFSQKDETTSTLQLFIRSDFCWGLGSRAVARLGVGQTFPETNSEGQG